MASYPVRPAVADELQRQMNQELAASYRYLAMCLWCELQHYKGFASFFRKQHEEERSHAERLIKHLIERDQAPVLAALPPPRSGFASLLEIAMEAQALEEANTAGVYAAFDAAVRENDHPARLLLEWFIKEQVEEEHWAHEMVHRVQRADCPGSQAELDRHIERYLSQETLGGKTGS
jgi:ferritin